MLFFVSSFNLFAQEPAAPERPVAPMIFEKPNSSAFEVIWFHRDFHSKTISNLTIPSRYFSPYQDSREGLVVSRVAVEAPFAVYSVSAYLDTSDTFPSLPGDQHSPLDLQLTVERAGITNHPTDIEFSSPENSLTPGFVTVYPNVSFPNGSSLFMGMQWRPGTPFAPTIGAAAGLGEMIGQQYGYLDGIVNRWQQANDFAGMEVVVLDWRPDVIDFGETRETSHFVIWFAAEQTTPISEAYASAVVSSDTLSWVTALESGGFISIVAVDSSGQISDTSKLRVDPSTFKKITLSSPEITFNWRRPSTLSQSVFVTNEATGSVNLRLSSDDSRVSLSDTTLLISGGSFKVITLTMTEPPRGIDTELHSLYIHNDRGWLPLKVNLFATPDIQTSVADESPKPLSFELSEVYPNPNFGIAKMRIVSPKSAMFKIEIFNVLGQLLQTNETSVFGESQIPITLTPSSSLPLAAGIYFVKITSGAESTMRKMVLVK